MMSGRVGWKRSDKRWKDDYGNEWASRLECEVFEALSKDERITVRKCERGGSDTFSYHSPVRGALCLECSGGEVVQLRTYTPDLHIVPTSEEYTGGAYYLEIKGHFPARKRSLLRSFLKSGPHIDLRMVFESDQRARGTKSHTNLTYARDILKVPACVWGRRLDAPDPTAKGKLAQRGGWRKDPTITLPEDWYV